MSLLERIYTMVQDDIINYDMLPAYFRAQDLKYFLTIFIFIGFLYFMIWLSKQVFSIIIRG